jgi:hypothetical protein
MPMPTVRLSNDSPVRIAGKLASREDNDQFHGELDDVFVQIG